MNTHQLIKELRLEGIPEYILTAMANIPRDKFVSHENISRAYDNTALPIGYEQTISQPYVVARMTEAVTQDGPLNKVLEIGTGSGYQAAILSCFAKEVYTIERIKPLCEHAQKVLKSLKMDNVHVYYADGSEGLPEQAPFDGIVITAALEVVPENLLSQLAMGGRMVAPVGYPFDQVLQVIKRTKQGFTAENINEVRFVPFKRGVE